MNAYTGRCLSHALPSAGCDCLADREVEERKRPCLWCAFEQGTEPLCGNSFVLAYGVFYCLGKLIIDLQCRDLKGFWCESARKKNIDTKKTTETESDCALRTSNGAVKHLGDESPV